MVSRARVALVLSAVLGLGILLANSACGTDAVGVESCRKVERVRCESAQACGIDLGRPVHHGDTPSRNVGACIRYYEDQCLHGLAAPTDPAPQAVDACVNAIITGSCEVVRTPESHPDCAWLIPPPEPAPAPAPVVDAATD